VERERAVCTGDVERPEGGVHGGRGTRSAVRTGDVERPESGVHGGRESGVHVERGAS